MDPLDHQDHRATTGNWETREVEELLDHLEIKVVLDHLVPSAYVVILE